jgi:2-C-methyl-D-erythritol 2,4-cyclodiphosphate synthase
MEYRIGQGYDVHAIAEGLPMWLGGVQIPSERGFVAHSDGDVAIHALCDALLGALALGDIGQHFPDTDPAYLGISSLKLLTHVWALITERGYRLGNLDVTVLAQKPKLAPYLPQMKEKLCAILGAEPDRVNIKATTEEHLGFTGREEGIACHAVCLLE